jgi:hypothetical protein
VTRSLAARRPRRIAALGPSLDRSKRSTCVWELPAVRRISRTAPLTIAFVHSARRGAAIAWATKRNLGTTWC